MSDQAKCSGCGRIVHASEAKLGYEPVPGVGRFLFCPKCPSCGTLLKEGDEVDG